jgi:hypothetical protein
MLRASARVLLFALGLSGIAAAAPSSNDSAAVPPAEPSAAQPTQPQPPSPGAGAAPQADRPRLPVEESKTDPEQPKLPWHDTWIILDNSVTAQTIGIGRSYQSSNPTYDLSASFRPRYYFYDAKEEGFYASGRIDVSREFTNSDTTTAQGETVVGGAPHGVGASDPTLFTVYRRRLAKRGDYETTASLWAPVLTLPLSKASQADGTYLGLGAQAWFYQDAPLAGSRATAFKKITFGVVAGYNHTFTKGTTGINSDVAANPELHRYRMQPDGRTIPGDQLTGAAFPEHEVRTTLRFVVEVAKDVSWWTDLNYNPTWKYPISDQQGGSVMGGQVTPLGVANPNTFVTVTGFSTSLFYHVINELTLGVGYSNASVQPGLDGQRRNIFYSPGALFSLTLIGHLDEMYLTAAGRRSVETAKR